MKIKDTLWIHALSKGASDMDLAKYGFPLGQKRNGSRVTPAEAAYYLGVNNIIMGMCDGAPASGSPEANDYLFTFTPMDKVLWPLCGNDGYRLGTEEGYLNRIKDTYGNVFGGYVGDVFASFRALSEPERTKRAIELFREMKSRVGDTPLYVSLYTHEIDIVSKELLESFDGIVMWMQDSDEIPFVQEGFEKIEEKFPKHRKMLGVSLFDTKNYRPTPLQLLDFNLRYGLKVVKTKRADGIVFGTNTVMGVGFETDSHLREWIKNNENTEI